VKSASFLWGFPGTIEQKPHGVCLGIILSGGPSSVFEKDAPHVTKEIFEMEIPILGICYGQQEIAWQLGGEVIPCNTRGYGHSVVTRIQSMKESSSLLLNDLPEAFQVWMSHGDQLSKIPPGFQTLAITTSAPHAAIGDSKRNIYGIQFHPEVTHTPLGKTLLHNFVLTICQCKANWTMESFVEKEMKRIQQWIGTGHVVGAVSGGVDSTVAAVLMHRAIGDR
jgi:GMP synthase (glutamine-hydrolysing)